MDREETAIAVDARQFDSGQLIAHLDRNAQVGTQAGDAARSHEVVGAIPDDAVISADATCPDEINSDAAAPATPSPSEHRVDEPAADPAAMQTTGDTKTPYQVMPDLTSEEYASLKADIEQRGVQVPILVDEDGNILDGHHRKRIADELGIDCPHETRSGLTHAEKTSVALALNVARRHLTREQRQKIIAGCLLAAPEKSDREVAKATGADHKTVARRREQLESTGEIPQLDARVGQDGKARMASKLPKPRKAIASSPKDETNTPAAPPAAKMLKPEKVIERFKEECIEIKQLHARNKLSTRDGFEIAQRAVSLLRYAIDTLASAERQSVLASLTNFIAQHEGGRGGTPDLHHALGSAAEASAVFDERPADRHWRELEGDDNDGL
jgi:ParB-like chromosome segregation protein Spo0J